MERVLTHRYLDPLDAIWLEAARRIGLRVRRSAEAFASSDGRGTLVLGERGTLDPDDHLAQMLLHELCHTLVEGPEAFSRPDWGLENTDDRDVQREHACLRVQATLAARHGLRGLFAPTTEHRAFWDALPDDPLSPGRGDSGLDLARAALPRLRQPPWHPHLERAFEATASVAAAVQLAGARGARDPDDEGRPSLWETLGAARPSDGRPPRVAPARHPASGGGLAPAAYGPSTPGIMPRHILPEDQIDPAIREKVAQHNRDLVDEVQAAVAAHDVVVVGMAQNPFPRRARKALDAAGVPYHYLEYGSYLRDWRRRNALKMWTGWGTFPMVFVRGIFVGGATDLDRLIESGELARRLA